jgi:hypothetical protein
MIFTIEFYTPGGLIMKTSKKRNDYIDELASTLPGKKIKKAYKEAEKEILQIRLSELREKQGIRQDDIKSFSQSSVSKLETRKDMKISTLIEYLDNIGLGFEIKAYTKDKKKRRNYNFKSIKITGGLII